MPEAELRLRGASDIASSRLAVRLDLPAPAGAVARAAELGVKTVFVTLRRSGVERTAGVYSFDSYQVPGAAGATDLDAVLAELRSLGLEPALTLTGGPAGFYDAPLVDPARSAWLAFVTATAVRYTIAPYNVRRFEIWQQPNRDAAFAPVADAAAYASLLADSAAAIHTVLASAEVASGGLAMCAACPAGVVGPAAYLDALFAAVGAPGAAAIGIHPLRLLPEGAFDATQPLATPDFVTALGALSTFAASRGVSLWMTSDGYPGPLGERAQAAHLARALLLELANDRSAVLVAAPLVDSGAADPETGLALRGLWSATAGSRRAGRTLQALASLFDSDAVTLGVGSVTMSFLSGVPTPEATLIADGGALYAAYWIPEPVGDAPFGPFDISLEIGHAYADPVLVELVDDPNTSWNEGGTIQSIPGVSATATSTTLPHVPVSSYPRVVAERADLDLVPYTGR